MRIAIIGAKGLPSLFPVGGGIETHVEHLARHLVDHGHDVTVYVRQYANPKQRKTYKGIKLITLKSLKTKHLDTISHVFSSCLHALTEPYDVIHVHGIGPSTLTWIPRLFKRNVRTIVTFHSRDQFHEKWGTFARLYLMFAEWAAVAFPHATVAVSHEIQLLCQKMFPGAEVDYAPNGVEIPEKPPGTNEVKALGLRPGHYFLHLARIVKHKAQDQSIQAFKMIDTSDQLVIAGSATFDDTQYLNELEHLAHGNDRILFTGHVSGDALKQLIAHARVVVSPSRSEGLSVAILEAMSYGRLVIMSDIPANLELIDHSGISVPVGNVKKLANAMQWALDDPEGAGERGARGKEIIRRLFSWPAVIKKIELVYEGKSIQPARMARDAKAKASTH